MCSTSRSIGIATAFAASITRSTSRGLTSLFLTATMPWLLKPLMWPPAMPVKTELISQPAIMPASATAFLIDSTVLSMLMTTPLRSPCEIWEPTPMTSTPRSLISPTTAQTFDVPMSRPTTMLFLLPIFNSPLLASALAHARDHLVAESQVQNRQALFIAFPERDDTPEALELVLPVARAQGEREAIADRIGDDPLARQKADLRERERLFAHEI